MKPFPTPQQDVYANAAKKEGPVKKKEEPPVPEAVRTTCPALPAFISPHPTYPPTLATQLT